ncbi:hypothetical protein [Streptomyces sp. NPDC001508]|uniref:hypothetical protein n=1 Tax=Streptomyces sp. NPDC001508 TaxID=3154656 RepID=UPI003326A344
MHPSADRRLAAEHWLLSTLDGPRRDWARMEWQQNGVALLPLGTLFSAVRLPGRLVTAAAGPLTPVELDAFLAQEPGGGPVICDPRGLRYYAVVPASMPVTWKQEVDDWRTVDVDCLGRGTYLGVPRVDATRLEPHALASYWSVPMASAALLCAPLTVARLIAAGRHRMPQEPEA